MASIYRPTYTHTDKATGKKTKRRLKKWYGKYRDAGGKLCKVPLSTNRAAAQQLLAELVKGVELERAGVVDPYAQHRRRPLAEHLADWERELRSRDIVPDSVTLKVGRCRRLVEGCSFRWLADLTASRVQAWLAELRTLGVPLRCGKGKRPRKGASVQTCNLYLQAVKAFASWLVDDERHDRNPLRRLRGGNPELDRRHVRRDLTDAEILRLVDTTAAAAPRCKLPGADRAMLYLLSAETGLRARELASMTPASLDLGALPTCTISAAYSKHRRQDVLPLHPALVETLRPWLATKAPGAPLWPGRWAEHRHAGKMLARDLVAGGIAPRTASGVADFHALRHSFISRIVRAGVLPKVAQELARHSTITLTLDRYAKLQLHDARQALKGVPPVKRPKDSGRESA